MVTTSKYQPGDMVVMISDPGTPGVIVGVTEWVGGTCTYQVSYGMERADLYAEEITSALYEGRQMRREDFEEGAFPLLESEEAPDDGED